jgi:iron complex outermembrane receptor protein
MHHLLNRRTLLAAATLAYVASAQIAFAQDADTPKTLDEVSVTAERRTQNVQDVPIAATVLSAEDLDKRGVLSLHDMQAFSPSVSITQVNRAVYVNIRGVGIAQTAPTSSPGVAYYIDGQIIPHEQFIGQSFYDLESVEVLRGPQGTLTGQNSTGGAIHVRTPAPDHGSNFGYFEQGVGNYGWLKSTGAVNLGINENVALRVAAVREERDSFTDNIGPSKSQPGNVEYSAARFNLALKTTDERLRVNLRGEYFDSDNDNNAVKRWNDTVSRNPFVIQEDAHSYMRQHGYRTSAEVNWAINPTLDLRWISSWQKGSNIDQADGDRTDTALPRPGVGRVGYTKTTFNTDVHEINLIKTSDGPVDWVVGAFLLEEEIPADVLRDNNNTVDFVSSTSTITTLVHNNSKSVFAQANARLGEKSELVVGGRRSWDRQTYDRLAGSGGVGSTTMETAETTGKLAYNFHVTKDVMLYASASKGYKAGGGNLPIIAPEFGPETNFVYEAGVKSTLFDRRLRLNATVFSSDYRDMQLASLRDGLPLTQNAASGKARGFELEATARLGDTTLNAGLGWLDAEFAADAALQNTISNRNELVPKGQVLPFSPEWTFNFGVQHDFEVGSKLVTPRLQWTYASEQYSTPFLMERTRMSSRSVVDARVSMGLTDNVKLDVFANNIFDKVYSTMQLMDASSAAGGTLYGAPRHFGLSVRYDFF